jgi:hypothetical protein
VTPGEFVKNPLATYAQDMRNGMNMSDADIEGDTLTRPEVTDGGDHDKFAHYVRKNDITESAVSGTAVIAICGKKWVPTRVPDEFPVCPDCKRIYDQLKSKK